MTDTTWPDPTSVPFGGKGMPSPANAGIAQGVGPGDQVHLSPLQAVVDNEPERLNGTSAYARPQPTDPGGTNSAGWMKTADYPTHPSGPMPASVDGGGYFSPPTDPGGWKQV